MRGTGPRASEGMGTGWREEREAISSAEGAESACPRVLLGDGCLHDRRL